MRARHNNFGLTITLVVLAALSTYYTTIENLKLELSGKAEETFVNGLDKRLSNLEIRLAENFASKKDFFQLKDELIQRLVRIEAQLDKNRAKNSSWPTANPNSALPDKKTLINSIDLLRENIDEFSGLH